MSTLEKAKGVYHEEGVIPLLQKGIRFVYDSYLRPRLPKRTVTYNSVLVRAAHLGDSVLPWHTTDLPGYEDALVRGIRKYVQEGDTVVLVGGGWGVSTVAAAEQTGDTGRILTFEGSKDAVEYVEETVQLNDVSGWVSVRHAIVARAVSLRGDYGGAKTVPPMELPECDVLVLDCEGAEIDILQEMTIKPQKIIVETHGLFGADTGTVTDVLDSRGYKVSDKRLAEPRLKEVCEENDIRVLRSHL